MKLLKQIRILREWLKFTKFVNLPLISKCWLNNNFYWNFQSFKKIQFPWRFWWTKRKSFRYHLSTLIRNFSYPFLKKIPIHTRTGKRRFRKVPRTLETVFEKFRFGGDRFIVYRVDGRPILKNVAFTKKSGYVWSWPMPFALTSTVEEMTHLGSTY